MLRKYVQKIVKSELENTELEKFYNILPDSNIVSQWEREHEELKTKIRHLKQDKINLKERLTKAESLKISVDSVYFNDMVEAKKLNDHFKKIIDKQNQDYLILSNKTENFKSELEKQKEKNSVLQEEIKELDHQLETKTLKNGNLQFNTYVDKYVLKTLEEENKNLKSKLSQQELSNKMLVTDKEKYTSKLNNYQNMVESLKQTEFKLKQLSLNHVEIEDHIDIKINNFIDSSRTSYEAQEIIDILLEIKSFLNEE